MVGKKNPVGLEPLRMGLCAPREQVGQAIRARVREELARMNALADSMGIPDDAARWYSVALELARLHVPELQEVKKDGRPKKWGDYELGLLVVELEREQKSRTAKKTQKEAANTLAQRSPWKETISKWGHGKSPLGSDPGEALLQQYKVGRKSRWADVARSAFAFHYATGSTAAWDQDVLDLREKK